jgi:hypothetical protein
MKRVLIGLHEFEGPYPAFAQIEHEPGIIAVLKRCGREFDLLAIEATADLHAFWSQARYRYGSVGTDLQIALCYMPGLSPAERRRAIEEIAQEFELVAA